MIPYWKSAFLALLLFDSVVSHAQSPLQQVVDAENTFARMSKEQNTRDAFVANLADSGIVFVQGNPAIGKRVWEKRPVNSSLLFWWPVFSDISASGDFGYNTGPFEFSKSKTENPIGFGYFSSVWKKEKDGIWRVAVDIGVSLPAPEEKKAEWKTSAIISKKNKSKNPFSKSKKEFLNFDKDYDNQLNQASVSILEKNLSSEARVHRSGYFPMITLSEIHSFIDNLEQYKFEHLGGDLASSADLAYAYGRVKAIDKKDKKEVTFNYLRIFKKEDGKNWKIVLDVIGG
jgi:ketosteroid isomerase-like protein